MNKLSFIGIIILGLVLLVTHITVTLKIVRATQLTDSHDIILNAENLDESTKTRLKKAAEISFEEHKNGEIKIELKDSNLTGESLIFDSNILTAQDIFDQNDINKIAVSIANEPMTITTATYPLSDSVHIITIKWPTLKLDVWVLIYCLLGYLLILFATIFSAIALLKIKKAKKQPNKVK
jgi:hypothetical protein